MTILEHALKYRALGWSIIPIKKGSKLPALKSWLDYQKRHPTDDELTEWFSKDVGIALICGRISGVICVDIDVKNGEPDIKGLELPPTLTAITGTKGRHLLYKWREGLIGPSVGVRKGVDIRSDNSYIVIDPSIHPNGNAYEWVNWGEDIAPAPKWLESVESPKKKSKKLTEVIGVSEGSRNEKMASLIGKLLMTCKSDKYDEEVWPVVMQTNLTYKPPLDQKELVTIYESIVNKETKRQQAIDDDPDNPNAPDEKEIVQQFVKSAKKGTYDLAMYIVKKYRIITVGEVEKEIYVYRNGMYMRAENEVIYPEIQRILKSHVNKSAKLETLHKIADATFRNRDVFKSAPYNLVPLKNGVYDTETATLLPHSHEYCFTFQFPIVYDATKLCPKSLQFMEQVLSPDQFLTVQEWLGYYFYRLYAFKKAIIFVGEGDTGKTTLLEMMTHLLGRQNISSISLQKMTGDKFSAAHMYEKHGNIVDELSAKDIHDTGQFKIATGGGAINGEHKFGNQFSFLNYSKLTFACNKIPDVKEMDDTAYFNRWMVIRFEKTIEKKIPNFIAQLTTEDERSGLFMFAMVGLKRLLEQGSFTYAKSAIDTKLEMMRSGSSIAQFASEGVREKQGSEITKERLYDEYVEYCTRLDLAVETMDLFSKKFMFYVAYVSDKSMYNTAGKRVRGWMNVEVIKQVETIAQELEADKEFEAMKEHAVDNL